MDSKNKALSFVVVVLVALAAVWWLASSRGEAPGEMTEDGSASSRGGNVQSDGEIQPMPTRKSGRSATVKDMADDSSVEGEDGPMDDGENTPATEEEKRADAEEALVDAFDALTDKWMEPVDNAVAMEDVQKFVAQFRKIPQARKGECLQRALNLVPDENVMLLAGILMDKTQDGEYLEMIYNDVLNRSEDVKQPILQQIFKDRTHPCWSDTAWILDVTGEASDANENQQ